MTFQFTMERACNKSNGFLDYDYNVFFLYCDKNSRMITY